MKSNLLSKFCHYPCIKYLPAYLPQRYLNSHTADICKTHRLTYTRTYPTVVVAPDGSSISIRYNEPRSIVKLPLDLSTLSELERKLRIEKRKPKEKVKIEEDIEDDFDANKYVHLIKK